LKLLDWSQLRPHIRFIPARSRIPVYPSAPVNALPDIAGRVRRALSTHGLTLYQLSQQSARIFGRSSPYYVPEQFYSGLSAGNANPSIHQLLALSRISRYRLSDWLRIFGFALDDISRLQILLPRRRTVLLGSTLYDEHQWIPWFTPRALTSALPAIAPLSQVLKRVPPTRASHLLALNTRRFLYAKVGNEDLFAFPDLVPGSIVRIDTLNHANLASGLSQIPGNRIFAVETDSGLTCGRLRRISRDRVALCSTAFSPAQLGPTLGRTTRILGVVDAEIRPMATQRPTTAPASSRRRAATHTPPVRNPPTAELGQLIRASRLRVGLSFREASAMSSSVSRLLADKTYFTSPGTLSDYDHLSAPPRHIQKTISLCILYCIGFWDFLRAGGLALDSMGNEPMPDELCGRSVVHDNHPAPEEHSEQTQSRKEGSEFLDALLNEWKEIPLFLCNSLPEISGLPHLSLFDFFWVRPDQDPADPRLVNAALLTVNRRLKRPIHSTPAAPREQPVYMMLKRDGGYLCGCCTLEGGVLAFHPHSLGPPAPVETAKPIDAEVIGQVTAILRRLP
jgi:hypothetical protein